MNEKVAIVGCGKMGHVHAEAYRKVGCDVSSCYDQTTETAYEMAKKYGAVVSGADFLREFPTAHDNDVDIVSICTPDRTHADIALKALQDGRHVFCEKPLVTCKECVPSIRHYWQESKKLLGCNLPLSTAPAYRYLLHHLDELGTMYSIDAEYCYGRLEKLTGDHWRNRQDYSIMLGGGIHMIDLICMLSSLRPTWVRAVGSALCLSEEPTSTVTHDYVTALLEYSQGLLVKITANFGSVTPHHHRLAVYGTKGTAIIDDMGLRLCFERDSPHTAFTPSTLSTKPEKSALVAEFVRAVRGEIAWSHTQRYFDSLSIAFACEESLRLGKEVQIEYV